MKYNTQKTQLFWFMFVIYLTCMESFLTLAVELPRILPSIPSTSVDGRLYIQHKNSLRATSIIEDLQNSLNEFIRDNGNPIAGVVLADVETGQILAMAQGLDPAKWGSSTHTCLHNKFPAASVFKTVGTIAALDLSTMEPDTQLPIWGSCGEVGPKALWLKNDKVQRSISLTRAFASSCNSFFAKVAVQQIGLGVINEYASRFGWGGHAFPVDFQVTPSPFNPPDPTKEGVQAIGRFSAGFGDVGMSPVHAAWLALILASDGHNRTIKLFTDETVRFTDENQKIFSESIGKDMRFLMQETVRSGTASTIFEKRPYKQFKYQAAGKTGTLTGTDPKGLTTWFMGLMPYDDPKVVVSAVVVNQGKWIIKAPELAAKALERWQKYKENSGDTFVHLQKLAKQPTAMLLPRKVISR